MLLYMNNTNITAEEKQARNALRALIWGWFAIETAAALVVGSVALATAPVWAPIWAGKTLVKKLRKA